MTDQQPHTPTTDRIRDLFSFAVAWDAEPTEPHIIAMQDKARKGFDRWLDARDDKLITAAEQRGAERALREAAKDWRWSAWTDAPRNPIAAANYTGDWIENRADRIADKEGDDE